MVRILPAPPTLDLASMMNEPLYQKSLFLFNDCIEYHSSCKKGAGNSSIREFNHHNPRLSIPRSAGIPVGMIRDGGYKTLTEGVISRIDLAFLTIKDLIHKHNYEMIIYPADKEGRFLVDNFYVGIDVISYITQRIHKLS